MRTAFSPCTGLLPDLTGSDARVSWDVLVLGAGQTGGPLAARLAEAGQRVLLVEREHVGGTCVNYGCTPTKTMIASARTAHVVRHAESLGVHAADVRVDFKRVVERKNELVQQWRSGVERRIARAGDRLTLIKGHGRFVGDRCVEINGAVYEAAAVVVDVGVRPAVPPITGLGDVAWLDNASLMELESLPAHLVVLGGGYIGCEFAQAFRRFGSEVTIIDRGEHLIGREDPEVSTALEQVFAGEGIQLCQRAEVEQVSKTGSGVQVRLRDGRTINGSHLLVAAGRTPNTDDLGCAAGGIELDDKGYIKVDDGYRTSAAGVYASGDVTGGPQFTHTAWDDHRLLYNIILGHQTGGRNSRLAPHAVFTDPQVAGVGLTEQQAIKQGIAYEAATFPFSNIARAIETGETAGLIKVLIDPASEQILGATIVGAEAAELIHIFMTLMLARAPARVLVNAQFVHPAFAEGVQSALMRLNRYVLR